MIRGGIIMCIKIWFLSLWCWGFSFWSVCNWSLLKGGVWRFQWLTRYFWVAGDWLKGVVAHLNVIMTLYKRLGQRWVRGGRLSLGWFWLSFPYRGSHVKRLSRNSWDVRDRGDHCRLSIHLRCELLDSCLLSMLHIRTYLQTRGWPLILTFNVVLTYTN